MTVAVFAAAKRLCEGSGWSISNLEMQKLLYIAHMFHLGRAGEPLISDRFEAWDYGPVQPSLYHKAKIYGSSHVGKIFRSAADLEPGSELDLINETVNELSHSASGRLVAITHWSEGAWAKHYVPGGRGIVIPNEDILQEYRDRERGAKKKKN